MIDEFLKHFGRIAASDKRVIFFTGDVGFYALKPLRKILHERYINAGVAEQNMTDVAAGMAQVKLQPWVYSIAPFITLKNTEQIRNSISYQKLNVKFIGTGGGFAYGIAGPTHHLLEDVAIITTFPQMKVYIPAFSDDISHIISRMYKESSPSYLRLGQGGPSPVDLPRYAGTRNIVRGSKVVMVVLGTIVQNSLKAIEFFNKPAFIDLWVVTEFPLSLPRKLITSIQRAKKLIIIEEHTGRGGLGEKLLTQLAYSSLTTDTIYHIHANGYSSKRFGSQNFHLHENNMDPAGILKYIKKII